MNVYIALIRGINVGGSNKLPMIELKQLFERHGCAARTRLLDGWRSR